MTVEVKSVEIGTDRITIEGLAIEDFFMAEDLYEDAEVATVAYEFDRTAEGAMRYLYKILKGQKRCASEKMMGSMLDKLVGGILWLPESFRAKDE